MASTGILYPSSGTSVSSNPYDDRAWSNPQNIQAASGYTIASNFNDPQRTHILTAKGFGVSIPAGQIILGVTVQLIDLKSSRAGVEAELIQFLNTSGSRVGNNIIPSPVTMSSSATTYTFGGPTELGGLELTRDWVVNSNFGIGFGALGTKEEDSPQLTRVSIEIEYGSPPAPLGNNFFCRFP